MRILLIEDEQGVARFIKKGLQEEGFAVEHAEDAEAGLELAGLGGFDVMVVDVMLPGMDGFTFCRNLRRGGDTTPVLMLTVKSGVKDKVSGLESGADDYLTKPFSFEEFLARIRALLRRPRGMVSLSCGNLEMNPLEHSAWIIDGGSVRLDLRPKEFAVLEYLVRNQGKVMSRTRMLENIWGYDFDPGTNILDVHIRRLREKLTGAGASAVIKTERGVGYAIMEESMDENT